MKKGSEERRRQDLERALATLQREQDCRIYGVVSFHMQAGRIVREEVKTTAKYNDLGG